MSEPDPGAPDADFELVEPMPWPLRLFLGAAGLACIGLSTWDLRHAILQPGWWTLLVGPILAGAWFVGGGFVAAAVAGEARRWRIRDGRVTIERRSPILRATETIRGDDVAATEIRRIEWDSRADGHAVRLRLKRGPVFETPDVGDRGRAEAIEAGIRRRLGLG